jgi:hypothetical protein
MYDNLSVRSPLSLVSWGGEKKGKNRAEVERLW